MSWLTRAATDLIRLDGSFVETPAMRMDVLVTVTALAALLGIVPGRSGAG